MLEMSRGRIGAEQSPEGRNGRSGPLGCKLHEVRDTVLLMFPWDLAQCLNIISAQ